MRPLTIKLRTIARKARLTKVINWSRSFFEGYYEQKFGLCMLSHVMEGDVVWDIGANLGFYSKQFLKIIGKDGTLICFEPAPACFWELNNHLGNIVNVKLEKCAMGDLNTDGYILIEKNPLATTHRVFNSDDMKSEIAGNVHKVSIVSGDTYWKKSGITPNIIKIDVEGFEEEVIYGMEELLKSCDVKAIFCEIHFKLLEERGKEMAPFRIENFFRKHAYQVSWIDFSHLMAVNSAHNTGGTC